MPLTLRKPSRGATHGVRASTVRSASVPAPVGGWNARDALADMKATDAVTLDNWFPRTSDCHLRSGFTAHVTGFASVVQSLMDYTSGVTHKLFAAAGSAVYDVTSSGAVGAAVISGLTNARWQHINFATPGGQFLFMVNGADDPRYYDGASWTTPSITGFTATTAIHVNAHKKHIWLIPDQSLDAYYLPVSSIAGAAGQFPLGPQATKGGYLVAMATWTIDGGDGTDDLAVFITSEGQAIVYKGIDPSSDFALVGVFEIDRPLGRRCFVKYGGDLVIVTNSGLFPLSKALVTGRATPKIAVSDKIAGAFHDAAMTHGDNFGWQVALYSSGPYLLVNVPTAELSAADQFIMNTTTSAWCRFTGMAANCWGQVDNGLYFGGATAVYLADDGESDNTAAIMGDCQPAFNYFSTPAVQKRFTMVRPIFAAGGTVLPSLVINTNFRNDQPVTPSLSSASGGTPWGSPWSSPWSTTGYAIRDDWQSVAGIGFCGSARVQVSTKTQEISLMSFDYVYEQGGLL